MARIGRRWRENRRRQRLFDVEHRVVERSLGGVVLRVAIEDAIGERWYAQHWPVLPEIELLKTSQLKPGSRVLDIGAHQAVIAMILARAVEPGGTVIAVEPSDHNVRVAAKNLDLNRVGNVHLIEAVATQRPGTALFDGGLNGRVVRSGRAAGAVEITAVTVDSVLAGRRADVVLVDVEGHEVQVLAGAVGALGVTPPADWFVEVHAGCGLEASGGSVDGVVACFPPETFDLLMSDGSQYGQFTRYEPGHPMTQQRFYLIALPRHGG